MRTRHPLTPFDHEGLPPTTGETLIRLFSVVAGSGSELSAQMLDEIAEISIVGVDPRWQIEQLKLILDRWAPKH